MHLKSVELHHFRNFPDGQFEFCPGLNMLFGVNASGKTNLLEAVHLLSNLRSFRSRSFRELISWDQKDAYIRGIVQTGHDGSTGSTKSLAIEIQTHGRTPSINSKRCKSSKDFLRILPSATFVPDDLSLVKGAPAFRRYFLDKSTFHFYPPYWGLLTDYNRVLRQKNVLLRKLQQTREKQRAAEACEVWNLQLQHLGSKIITQRLLFVKNLQRLLTAVYADWLGSEEMLDIQYKHSITVELKELRQLLAQTSERDIQQVSTYLSECYGKTLDRSLERELRLGTCIVGPHRDDLELRLAGRPLRSYGSQGQQRTAVLALMFAEIQLYYEQYEEYPLLLLDDVSSELDVQRNEKLFGYLQQGMQVFITATDQLESPILQTLPCAYFDLSKRKVSV